MFISNSMPCRYYGVRWVDGRVLYTVTCVSCVCGVSLSVSACLLSAERGHTSFLKTKITNVSETWSVLRSGRSAGHGGASALRAAARNRKRQKSEAHSARPCSVGVAQSTAGRTAAPKAVVPCTTACLAVSDRIVTYYGLVV